SSRTLYRNSDTQWRAEQLAHFIDQILVNRIDLFFFLSSLRPPISTLFPYTTLFRSFVAGDVAYLVGPYEELLSVLRRDAAAPARSEEHTSELQSQSNLVCRPLLEKKKEEEGDDIVLRLFFRIWLALNVRTLRPTMMI